MPNENIKKDIRSLSPSKYDLKNAKIDKVDIEKLEIYKQ
jgi:hypothetical protein